MLLIFKNGPLCDVTLYILKSQLIIDIVRGRFHLAFMSHVSFKLCLASLSRIMREPSLRIRTL